MADEKSLQSVEGEGVDECPSCKSKRISREDNEMYCEDCGLVLD